MPPADGPEAKRKRWLWRLGLSIAAVSSLALFLTHWRTIDWSFWSLIFSPESLAQQFVKVGGWGPVFYIFIIMVSVIISQIPGAPLAVIAGAIWDPFTASVYTVIGGFSGALVAYGLGYCIGPSLMKIITGKTLSLASDRGTPYLGGLIFATRLLPVLSFDLVSYGAGISRLSFPVYAVSTFLGMIPSTFLLTYMGDHLQINAGAIAILSITFLGIFVGLPLVLQRFRVLNISDFVRLT